jgi:hypothetical protein
VSFDGGLFVNDEIKQPHRLGDILWVRETWNKLPHAGTYFFKADDRDVETGEYAVNPYIKWRPSIHMPRAAARIFLRVTDVRAERLQNICETDAKAEGFDFALCKYKACDCPNVIDYCADSTGCFGAFWDSLSAKRGYGWDANPWVWVYTFERVDARLLEVTE